MFGLSVTTAIVKLLNHPEFGPLSTMNIDHDHIDETVLAPAQAMIDSEKDFDLMSTDIKLPDDIAPARVS